MILRYECIASISLLLLTDHFLLNEFSSEIMIEIRGLVEHKSLQFGIEVLSVLLDQCTRYQYVAVPPHLLQSRLML